VAVSIAELAGANTRRLRQGSGVTLSSFAAAVELYGLPWSTGRAVDFERGRAAPSLTTLLVVAAALSRVLGRDVTLAELLVSREPVQVTDRLTMAGAALSAAMSGQPVKRSAALSGGGTLRATAYAIHEADRRICKNLGVDFETGKAAMWKLWSKPFTAERDRRAGPDANAQRRGIVSRQLKAELLKALADGNN
jgi:transcriptional regulator with XRE-family HTH domain